MKKLTLRKSSLRLLPIRLQNDIRQLIANRFRVDQGGFIPMLLCIIGVIALVIFLVYSRVAHVNR